MFRPSLGFALLCSAACAGTQHPVSSGPPSERLADLSERYWTLNLKSAPLDWMGRAAAVRSRRPRSAITASMTSSTISSSAGRARFLAALVGIEREARAIPDEGLQPEDRLTKALLLDLIAERARSRSVTRTAGPSTSSTGRRFNLPLTANVLPARYREGRRRSGGALRPGGARPRPADCFAGRRGSPAARSPRAERPASDRRARRAAQEGCRPLRLPAPPDKLEQLPAAAAPRS